MNPIQPEKTEPETTVLEEPSKMGSGLDDGDGADTGSWHAGMYLMIFTVGAAGIWVTISSHKRRIQ